MRAIVLLSGGLDSATVLASARKQNYDCFALTIDYGQRHAAELAAAGTLARRYGAVEHRVVHIDYDQFGGSALTDVKLSVPTKPSPGIPVTYVPARNTVMLSIALGWAEVVAAGHIFIGVNAVDFSGYPDCRPEFIAAFQALARVATKAGIEGNPVTVHAPLIRMSKADIIALGTSLGVEYAVTVSCYQADTAGRACGECEACRLRRQGFAAAEVDDPTRYSD
ncbi:MAG: 7-cyano-7-deazaguanine synthase QueC [Gammaproteobacteria bacterium]|jgi:7-cyano-7-deazaguanine synthase|nr:7-cyano-7-deazaguanine synthase QueC [Gammaproteobacteria bacterium]HJP34774.1 7-cyano-7-deazaguanine synthase QueC [Gammaproteobacteria bacterium]